MPALIPDAWPCIAGEPDRDKLPRRVTKKDAAALLTTYKFKVSPRALQDWPDVDWLVVNAKATCETAEIFAAADRRLAEGRRRSAASVAQPVSTRPASEVPSQPVAEARPPLSRYRRLTPTTRQHHGRAALTGCGRRW